MNFTDRIARIKKNLERASAMRSDLHVPHHHSVNDLIERLYREVENAERVLPADQVEQVREAARDAMTVVPSRHSGPCHK